MTGDSHEVELRGQELSELILREALEKVLYMGEPSSSSDLTTTPPPPPPIRAGQFEELQRTSGELSAGARDDSFAATDCAVNSSSQAVRGSRRQTMAALKSSSIGSSSCTGDQQAAAHELARSPQPPPPPQKTTNTIETAEEDSQRESAPTERNETESENKYVSAPARSDGFEHEPSASKDHEEVEEELQILSSDGENSDEEKMQQVEMLQVEAGPKIAQKVEEEEEREEIRSEAEKSQQQQLEMITKQTLDACSTSSGNSSGSLGLADDDDDDVGDENDDDDDERNDERNEKEEDEAAAGHEDEEDFCGEMASNSNLRRLRMDTVEDVSICEQNRQSMEAARKLFGELEARQRERPPCRPDQSGRRPLESGASPRNGRSSAPPIVVASQAAAVVAATGASATGAAAAAAPAGAATSPSGEMCSSSLSSGRARSSGSLSGGSDGRLGPELELECERESRTQQPEITIVRRSGSSLSGSNRFGQTLVCSVSPIELADGPNSGGADQQQQQLAVYPIDGEEMRQCREAFRQNRRLIQEQQERAANSGGAGGHQDGGNQGNCQQQQQRQQLDGGGGGSRSSRVQSILLQRQQWSVCSRCQKRLYPLDQLELDFTRTKLNIHRNCFKCQICSTLLRLETYKAMDAKLYCPAHVRCATPAAAAAAATQSGATAAAAAWP